MRLGKIISIYFIYPLTFLVLGFWLNGKWNAAESCPENEQQEEADLEVAFSGKAELDADTRFIVRRFDLSDSSRTETEEEVPEKYIGMDREAFLAAIEEYECSPSLEDRQLGFLSMNVERFAQDEVIVQKNYESSEKNTVFYLAVENNYIIVYEADKRTRYLSTGIPIRSVPEELAQEIMGMKRIGSEKELYDFLESYSS